LASFFLIIVNVNLISVSKLAAQERKTIASAMADYHKKTCIRFAPRKTQSDYLKIIKSKESQSWSGYPG
jgi:hypothetical protein